MGITFLWLNPMQFASRLIQLRKAHNLTQQGLAHAVQILPEGKRRIIKALLDGMIVKHQIRQMFSNLS